MTETVREGTRTSRLAGASRAWASRAFTRAAVQNRQNLHELLAADRGEHLIDLGCDDGTHSVQFGANAGAVLVHGLDIDSERVRHAAARGMVACAGDLNERFPFSDESFDIVCSNQVIEHVKDTDRFVSETYRILRPGGYALISTENLASWHNLAALLFGWQPFSLTNVSARERAIGNPLALHR